MIAWQQLERARRGDEGQLPAPDCRFAAGMGSFGFGEGREWSAIRKVARETVTTTPQRGHLGVIVLPVTPSRYERARLQWGQGPNDAYAMRSPFTLEGGPSSGRSCHFALRALHRAPDYLGRRALCGGWGPLRAGCFSLGRRKLWARLQAGGAEPALDTIFRGQHAITSTVRATRLPREDLDLDALGDGRQRGRVVVARQRHTL